MKTGHYCRVSQLWLVSLQCDNSIGDVPVYVFSSVEDARQFCLDMVDCGINLRFSEITYLSIEE